MKKFVSLLLVLLTSIAISSASAAQYTEGKQYTKVAETKSNKVEVREYFSFYCPHCFRFEPFMESVKAALPTGVSFERNHVDFLRAASPKVQMMLTKATIVADEMGMGNKLVGAIFNYIHVQRATITSEKDVRNIFVLNGADGAKFDKLMKSFGVNSKAKLMKKNQDIMSKSQALKGVPAVFINGKYRINNPELDKNNFEKDYNNLIKYLLTLD